MQVIKINCAEIHNREPFHEHFQVKFGFPVFYGKNMNAWIDCMTYLDDEDDGMSAIKIESGSTLTMQLQNVKQLKIKCPEIYEALLECSAFVNYRRIDVGENPIIILSFFE